MHSPAPAASRPRHGGRPSPASAEHPDAGNGAGQRPGRRHQDERPDAEHLAALGYDIDRHPGGVHHQSDRRCRRHEGLPVAIESRAAAAAAAAAAAKAPATQPAGPRNRIRRASPLSSLNATKMRITPNTTARARLDARECSSAPTVPPAALVIPKLTQHPPVHPRTQAPEAHRRRGRMRNGYRRHGELRPAQREQRREQAPDPNPTTAATAPAMTAASARMTAFTASPDPHALPRRQVQRLPRLHVERRTTHRGSPP